jgi:hypothetical protein
VSISLFYLVSQSGLFFGDFYTLLPASIPCFSQLPKTSNSDSSSLKQRSTYRISALLPLPVLTPAAFNSNLRTRYIFTFASHGTPIQSGVRRNLTYKHPYTKFGRARTICPGNCQKQRPVPKPCSDCSNVSWCTLGWKPNTDDINETQWYFLLPTVHCSTNNAQPLLLLVIGRIQDPRPAASLHITQNQNVCQNNHVSILELEKQKLTPLRHSKRRYP